LLLSHPLTAPGENVDGFLARHLLTATFVLSVLRFATQVGGRPVLPPPEIDLRRRLQHKEVVLPFPPHPLTLPGESTP